MLAGMRTLVFAHHREGFLGDRPHLFGAELQLQIQHRTDMQAADRGMRIPGAVGAVFFENPGQPVGVFGEILEPHRAILDKRHRLPVALHRHHDVEPLLAHVPHRALEGRVGRLDDRAGKAEIAHQFDEPTQAPQIVVSILAGEFAQQDRLRLASDEALDDRAEHRVVARQLDHRAVDQLDRRGTQLDDVLGRLHRLVKAREMADAEDPVRRDRLKVELDLGEEGEGALRADKEMGHVVALITDHINVVAADPALHFREAALDLIGLATVQRAHVAHEVAVALGRDIAIRTVGAKIAGYFGEMRGGAVGEDRVDRADIVHHIAVAQRARAAAVVGGHPADRRAVAGRDIDRVE